MIPIEKIHPTEPAEREDTREKIAATATRLFAAHGFHGVSTKQICDEAGANIAAVNYHFGTKENLYRALVKRFGDLGFQRLAHLLKVPTTPDEMKVRVEMFLEESVDLFRSQPELSLLIFRDIHMMRELLHDIFEVSFLPLHKAVVGFIDGARRNGLIAKEIHPELAAGLLFDHVSNIARECPLRKMFTGFDISDPKDRDRLIKQTVRIFLNGVRA
jgi:AcrR family transcriptional regulator